MNQEKCTRIHKDEDFDPELTLCLKSGSDLWRKGDSSLSKEYYQEGVELKQDKKNLVFIVSGSAEYLVLTTVQRVPFYPYVLQELPLRVLPLPLFAMQVLT